MTRPDARDDAVEIMTPEAQFDIWAPPPALWSRWAKPVLFAHLRGALVGLGGTIPVPELPWLPAAVEGVALVADLPEAAAVQVGLAAARRGYRPVPLYNGGTGPGEVIPMLDVLSALADGGEQLAKMSIPADAPPAFLLDSRREGHRKAQPGQYDNRWVVLPQDFPSGNFLLANGIRGALLIQPSAQAPRYDLAHVLRRWQEAGIAMRAVGLTDGSQPRDIDVERPSRFRSLVYRIAVLAGLRANAAGGFGGVVPMPSEGGGGYRGFG